MDNENKDMLVISCFLSSISTSQKKPLESTQSLDLKGDITQCSREHKPLYDGVNTETNYGTLNIRKYYI